MRSILEVGHKWVPDFGWVEGTQEEKEEVWGVVRGDKPNEGVFDFLNFVSSRTFRKKVSKVE